MNTQIVFSFLDTLNSTGPLNPQPDHRSDVLLIERFFNYLQYEKRFSTHTVTAYIKDLEQFLAYIKCLDSEINFKIVTYQDVRAWIVSMMGNDQNPKTVNRKLSVLRSFYKFLVREGLVSENVALKVKTPKIPKRLPVFVEETKMDYLLDDKINPEGNFFSDDFPGLRDRLVLELFYGTGIRLAELLALKETDINSFEQTIIVLGKRNKQRIIPLTKPLTNLLDTYIVAKKQLNFNNISTVLIVTDTGKSAYPKYIYRMVNKYLSIISTHDKKSPHILRHSFATSLLNRGADLNSIKELLGHASLAATQVYTHNSVERLKTIYKQAHPKA